MEDQLIKKISEELKDSIEEARVLGPKRLLIKTLPKMHRDVIKYLKDKYSATHLITITGVDFKDFIELTYLLWCYGPATVAMVKTRLPRDNPEIETILDIIPGALLYEREVHDLLGVFFKNHPNLERTFLPEDWPDGVYPLRKDVRFDQI
ncbi:MAG: NADH-quinone oxidoreductase subunit C [Nitrososphaerota archaeon]|nr:NADH-quinone oxidoreductase subunit C [Nitrososphaerales archaeon]MCX8192044.1 NADH-quinone oxidoreductase subunit C [Nitrososphaerales archaeon]MDW8044505.1 NADH-quinone oxidoreductase subunit C [Nitrososphaerota archaeon]